MIQEPVRHRRACWVVRGAGRANGAVLRRSRYTRITLREAEGLLLGPGEVTEVYGAAPVPHSLAELEDGTGEWVGLLADERDETWVAMTDFHGFGHLFYYVHRTTDSSDVYLATTLDVLVDQLRGAGIRLAVNWPYAATTLASSHTMLRNQWAEETLIDGVLCLRPDQVLVMSAAGVGPVPRPMTSDPAGRSYDELIDAGVERSTRLLRQVSETIDDVRFFASGGRDSRVVLALLAHAGAAPRVSFVSADPLRWPDKAGRDMLWRDLLVADGLRRDLGRGWYVESEHEDRMLSLDESLRHHQSFYAGKQWVFSAERQLRWPVRPYAAVRGGAGELMRTAYSTVRSSKDWAAMGDTAGTLRADIHRLHSLCINSAVPLPPELEDAGRESFARAFAPVPGAGISEQVDGHYRLHRNRVHFGHILHSLHRRSPAIYPLAMPEFLRAAQLLPFEHRDLGSAAFDVIERLRPELNRQRFAGGSWPEELWRMRDPSFTARPAQPRGPFARTDATGYFDQEEINHGRRGHQSGLQRFEILGATQTSAVHHLWQLHDLAPGDLSADLTAALSEQVGLGRLNPATTMVRLESLLRAVAAPVAETPPASLQVQVQTGGRGPARLLRRRPHTPAPVRSGAAGSVRSLADIAANRASSGLETFDSDPSTPPALFCHAAYTDEGIVGQRVGGERVGWAFTHTFTLLRGTTTVAEVNAGENVRAVLAPSPEPGRYRVRLTARYTHRPEIALRPLSQPVVVPPAR